MPSEGSFADLITRLRAGDSLAEAAVFHRYRANLIALARSRLDPATRRKQDPEEVVQSVYRSFFLRHAGGLVDVQNWDSLWTMLTVITVRKCVNYQKHYHRARRDVQREVSADEAGAGWDLVSREPTPEAAALLTDTVEQLMHGLEQRQRDILAAALQGLDVPGTAAEVGCAERTVRRVLALIKKRLQRLQVADA